MSFTEYLKQPELDDRYRKIRSYFFLRESVYDLTSECQLRCDGCYYFQGDKYKGTDETSADRWRAFMAGEKERGITYVNLAGAEPTLSPDLLRVCWEAIPLGTIFTNGLAAVDPELGYRIHVSVWGDSAHDPVYRRAVGGKPGPDCLPIQLSHFENDARAIFVYTFNQENTDQLDEVIARVAGAGHQLTFNIFSAAGTGKTSLRLGDSLDRIRDKMLWAMQAYPESVVYSKYSAEVHTRGESLHEQFGCPFPRVTAVDGRVGLGKTFRAWRTDLTHSTETDCCIPDTQCEDCRHYAAGSAIVTARLNLHTETERAFRGWLDYVDTYLAVFVPGYEKGPLLYS